MRYDTIAILIPAYKPDDKLLRLVDALIARGFPRICVVDDGGGEKYAKIFSALSGKAEVLTHAVNRGKGAALKTGLSYLMGSPLVGVVTCDADGQHTPDDCAKVADALLETPNNLILGSRDKRQMPPRSKFGNSATCIAFFLTTYLWIGDTQTGLRALPAAYLPQFAALEGDRYEYELNMLLCARRMRLAIREVTIETIYIDDNKGSHFHAVRDGARIYGLLFRQAIRYTGSAALAAGIDYGLYALLGLLGASVDISFIAARAVSSFVNYIVNRELVFHGDRRKSTVVKYYLLAGVIALAGLGLVRGLICLGMSRYVAQPVASAMLYVFSYQAQKRWIFKGKV